MSESFSTLTWRVIQDQLDKGVLPQGEALDYLGDLLGLIALRAPELLDETTRAYGQPASEGGLPPTENADL